MSADDIKDLLTDVKTILEEIRSLTIFLNQEKLTDIKSRLIRKGSVKERVYNICDETKIAEEMAQVLGKETGYVHSYLNRLRREGPIRNTEREGRQVYPQIF